MTQKNEWKEAVILGFCLTSGPWEEKIYSQYFDILPAHWEKDSLFYQIPLL